MANSRIKTSTDVRFAYPHLLTPVVSMNGGTPKFSVCIIISKTDPCLASIKAALEQVYKENLAIFKNAEGGVLPMEKLRTPLHDGDIEHPGDANFAGCCFLNAYTTTTPVVVDANKSFITDERLLTSGMTGRAVLSLYAYNHTGNAGIGVGLEGVQKLGDSRRSAILAEFE